MKFHGVNFNIKKTTQLKNKYLEMCLKFCICNVMLASWDTGKPCKGLVFNYEGFKP